jgi:cobalt/nickel transport system permease protein
VPDIVQRGTVDAEEEARIELRMPVRRPWRRRGAAREVRFLASITDYGWLKSPAMHIPDGFLSNRVAVSLDVVSGAGVLYAARRVKVELAGRIVPIMGVLAAFVFAAQMINFPVIGGTSGHLIGGALLGAILGPTAGLLTMATVIIAQALFLQDGGLVALGANIFNIGAVTTLSGYSLFRLFGGPSPKGKRLVISAFIAAWVSLLLSAGCCAVQMALSGVIPLGVGLPAMLGYHAIIGIAEGALTAGVLSFLAHVRPDLASGSAMTRLGPADWIWSVVFVLAPGAVLLLAGTSNLPDPLERLLSGHGGPREPDPAALASALRYEDYLIRAGVFVVLLGAAFLGVRLARSRRS